MSSQESFNTIVQNFKNEVSNFLAKNGLDEYSILVYIDEDRPTGKIMTMRDEIQKDVCYFNDARFSLVQDWSKRS